MGEFEGITVVDASVTLNAQSRDDIPLANDTGLIEVARSLDVEVWWVTTALLKGKTDNVLHTDESTEIIQDLVDYRMNLHPKVYSPVHTALQDFE